MKTSGIIGVSLLLAAILAYVFVMSEKRESNLNKQLDSLRTTTKLMESSAKMHEFNAIRHGEQAAKYKKKVDDLRDSLRTVIIDRTRIQKIYENSIHNPIRLSTDHQRDSILAVLY